MIYTIMNTHLYYTIRQIPKVYRILKQGDEYYTRIVYEEIRPILKLINEKSIIDYSRIFIENSKVYVKDGPLKGMEGIILSDMQIREKAEQLSFWISWVNPDRSI